MAWEENPRICLHMQLIAILSRTEVEIDKPDGLEGKKVWYVRINRYFCIRKMKMQDIYAQ